MNPDDKLNAGEMIKLIDPFAKQPTGQIGIVISVPNQQSIWPIVCLVNGRFEKLDKRNIEIITRNLKEEK
jgi:hypothetical protein